MKKGSFLKNYGFLICMLIGIVAGCIVGAIWPATKDASGEILVKGATVLEPLGTVFLNLMFCIAVPTVFCSISSAIANMQSAKRAGKIMGVTIATFLSACIARTVADRGYSVCYVSAEALFADFEQQKFRPREGEDVTRKYLACDLLILDDLGTEMTTQFTIAALYQVVNTRLMESRATIVSTNLPVGELDRRYSAQIASRLLGAYTLYKFSGKDIRMLQKSMARPTADMNR